MKSFLGIIVPLFLIFSTPLFSQTKSEEKRTDVESAKAKRKKDKKIWKERRKEERGEKQAVKSHNKSLQTKETRKRMRKNKSKANRRNENKKEFYLIRYFKPKPRTGAW